MASNRRVLLSDAQGGLGKVHQLFGAELHKVIEEMNPELAE